MCDVLEVSEVSSLPFTRSNDSMIPRKYRNCADNSKADRALPVVRRGRRQPSFVTARLSFCCGDRVEVGVEVEVGLGLLIEWGGRGGVIPMLFTMSIKCQG